MGCKLRDKLRDLFIEAACVCVCGGVGGGGRGRKGEF